MSRKQTVCYFVIACVLTLAVLVLLAILNIWLMLLAVLLIVLILGVLLQRRPNLFAFLRRPRQPAPDYAAARTDRGRTSAASRSGGAPGMVLVSLTDRPGAQIPINKTVFTLGRDPSCSYVIRSRTDISRVHATLRYDAARRQTYITDNSTYNETYVNNIRLSPGTPKKLSHGDVLQLGPLRFTVQAAHY